MFIIYQTFRERYRLYLQVIIIPKTKSVNCSKILVYYSLIMKLSPNLLPLTFSRNKEKLPILCSSQFSDDPNEVPLIRSHLKHS